MRLKTSLLSSLPITPPDPGAKPHQGGRGDTVLHTTQVEQKRGFVVSGNCPTALKQQATLQILPTTPLFPSGLVGPLGWLCPANLASFAAAKLATYVKFDRNIRTCTVLSFLNRGLISIHTEQEEVPLGFVTNWTRICSALVCLTPGFVISGALQNSCKRRKHKQGVGVHTFKPPC